MTPNRMKDETLLLFIFITFIDFANSLYLSQSSVTTEPGKSLAISCRDPGGQPVTWKGPKGALNANTKPKIQDTSIGKLLVFTPTRVQDTGNYTCSLMNNKNEFKVFALVVEEIIDEESSHIDHRKHLHKNHRKRLRTHETSTASGEDDSDTTFEIETSTIEHSYTHRGHYRDKYPTEEPLYFKDTPEVQRGKEGENVTLRCEINKPYKISWLPDKNDESLGERHIPIADGLLILNVSRKEDNRIFICEVVKSTTGQVIQKKIRFIVEHKPEAVTYPLNPETGEPLSIQNDKVYGFIGENVNLTCEVEAEPPPRIEWRSNKLGPKKIGRILNESNHKSILQLKMTPETVDKYQCIASNKHGKLKIFYDLQIGTRPDPPGGIQLLKAESNSLELKVEVPEPDEEVIENGMEPRWLNIFYRREESTDWDEQIFNITLETFTLTELNSSTKYEIMAATRNVAGLSAISYNTTFFETKSASSVQIQNLSVFSVALINTLIFLTSRLA